jgi:hypothetical protein
VPAKLYVVVDEALPPGLQLAQATHAAFQLSVVFPERVRKWHLTSNFLVVLAAPISVLRDFHERGPEHIPVFEPDLPENPLVALAFLPDPRVNRLLSALPLALKERAMT